MTLPRDRWFWIDLTGLLLSLTLLTWSVWSALEEGSRGAIFAALPAIIFAVRLARRARPTDA